MQLNKEIYKSQNLTKLDQILNKQLLILRKIFLTSFHIVLMTIKVFYLGSPSVLKYWSKYSSTAVKVTPASNCHGQYMYRYLFPRGKGNFH